MKTIIDGYNLLMTCGFVSPDRVGPGTLQRARQMLVGILKQRLDQAEWPMTAIVFDSNEVVEEASESVDETISVFFATEFDSADSMIEQMIRKHSVPRQLTVVSSDHRIQNAATRRKAKAVDSDEWFFEQLGTAKNSNSSERAKTVEELLKENQIALSDEDSLTWTDLFSQENPESNSEPRAFPASPISGDAASVQDEGEQESDEIWNPFPEGYGDDLLDES